MAISVFDLYSIGIGPSSSHTVGPMRAAFQFLSQITDQMPRIHKVKVDLYGSLALTGKGHGTDKAILLGLEGNRPESTDPEAIAGILERIHRDDRITLLGEREIAFVVAKDLQFHMDRVLPHHSNGMRFAAFDESGEILVARVYYSIGGGFIVDHDHAQNNELGLHEDEPVPYPFSTTAELLAHCKEQDWSISEVIWENEKSWRTEKEIREGLMEIWEVMRSCVRRGCFSEEEFLPGGLDVRRRAPEMRRHLEEAAMAQEHEPGEVMDWVSMWALAVNEENAAGGQVVTAPTNGAAGIIPAVLHYYEMFVDNFNPGGVIEFMLTAGAIGILYKEGASISAAEVGCQGEVGVACSMSAAGLAAVRGASVQRVEQAAEIGMEHNLGLTCDPVGGLVQIPCIERNTMGALKAINAARLALRGGGANKVTLDQVIATMRQTGLDMQSIYKETSQGGLAVNVTEC